MRITCPNCGAQYEVDDALIPESGRDVQCSNCGRGWFQTRHEDEAPGAPPAPVSAEAVDEVRPEPDFDAEAPDEEPPVTANTFGEIEPEAPVAHEAEETDGPADQEPDEEASTAEVAEFETEETWTPPPEDTEEPEGTDNEAPVEAVEEEPPLANEPELPAEDAPKDTATEETEAAPGDEEPEEEDEAPAPMAPRQTDEAVLAVLREEAEREIAARRHEQGGSLETQPDLGLEETPDHGAVGPAAAAAGAAAIASGTRRDLLPDIDEINSTLRSDADREAGPAAEDEGAVVRERRRGFRLGFGLVILIVAALIGTYVMSEQIVDAVPSLEPYVISYVDWANGVRDWFDGILEAGVSRLSE